MTLIALFVALILVYSLVSERLERTVVTGPIVFTTAGILMAPARPALLKLGFNQYVFLRLAEVGLVMLLFTDASRTQLKALKHTGSLPARLLSTGMLLTIAIGALCARLVFPNLSLWEAGILASILAPTDAGLGQVIVNSPRVPMRIRNALNVEAGLNDGLSVPFLLFFIALATTRTEGSATSLKNFIVEQLGFGLLIGTGIGFVGGWSLSLARRKQWMAASFQQIGVVTLPLLCLVVSEMGGASMFIAAFVAGLAVQLPYREAGTHSVDFAEEWGQLINFSVFFLFGVVVARTAPQFTLALALYAVLSLTVVRMLPVMLALAGTHLSPASLAFMGWFGPRGLASIVLGLVYLEQEMHLAGEQTISLAVIVTVGLSIFLHGLSAMPGISLYAAKLVSLDASAPERRDD